jgi:hypothetical protein
LKEVEMLVLSLGIVAGDEAVITTAGGEQIVVRAVETPTKYAVQGKVRVGFEAARSIRIDRRPITRGSGGTGKVAGAAGLAAAMKVGGVK